jgi:hypothetical protein
MYDITTVEGIKRMIDSAVSEAVAREKTRVARIIRQTPEIPKRVLTEYGSKHGEIDVQAMLGIIADRVDGMPYCRVCLRPVYEQCRGPWPYGGEVRAHVPFPEDES